MPLTLRLRAARCTASADAKNGQPLLGAFTKGKSRRLKAMPEIDSGHEPIITFKLENSKPVDLLDLTG